MNDTPVDCGEFYFNKQMPVEITQRNLPHWRQTGVYYFITFRTSDSLPKQVQNKLRHQQKAWLEKHCLDSDLVLDSLADDLKKEYYYLFSKRIHELLDSGYGNQDLLDFQISQVVEKALKYFDGCRYILDAWVIMPNHVHLLMRTLGDNSLSAIMHSLKSYTAKEINKIRGRTGSFWAKESFDYIVRSYGQLEKFREYIKSNPIKGRN